MTACHVSENDLRVCTCTVDNYLELLKFKFNYNGVKSLIPKDTLQNALKRAPL